MDNEYQIAYKLLMNDFDKEDKILFKNKSIKLIKFPLELAFRLKTELCSYYKKESELVKLINKIEKDIIININDENIYNIYENKKDNLLDSLSYIRYKAINKILFIVIKWNIKEKNEDIEDHKLKDDIKKEFRDDQIFSIVENILINLEIEYDFINSHILNHHIFLDLNEEIDEKKNW